MVSSVEIFEAVTDEVLFNILGEDDGDVAAQAALMTLTMIVEGLTDHYVLNNISPAIPVVVDIDGENEVNPFWSDDNSFAPIYAILAEYYFQAVAPKDFPDFPTVKIVRTDSSVFGFDLVGFDDRKANHKNPVFSSFFAGCCALAVQQCFMQPMTIILGYLIACRRLEAQI